VVEYPGGKRIKWEEGAWSGPPDDVARLERRAWFGPPVDISRPGPLPADDVSAVRSLIYEVVGEWAWVAYSTRHPGRFVVKYEDGRRITWEKGVWAGPADDVARLRERVASGIPVRYPLPLLFPPNHVQSVKEVIAEVLGPWSRTVENKLPDSPWFEDPPMRVY